MDQTRETASVDRLADLCSARVAGRSARERRVPLLLNHFHDLLDEHKPIITVTGTSGKGSTCALLGAILQADGHVPGVFTSPHLVGFHERIRVRGRPIDPDDLSRHIDRLMPRLRRFLEECGPESCPSLFEALVLVAFSVFRESGVTASVFEAAIGGANDAMTGSLPATLSVLTSVGLDHQDELGDTLEEIARDKAGIAPPGGVLVLGAGMPAHLVAMARLEAGRRGVRCVEAEPGIGAVVSSSIHGQRVRIQAGGASWLVDLPFPGHHQVLNLATAWSCVQVLHELGVIGNLESITGARDARIPGRLEFVEGRPSWLLDVAHNPDSIRALASTVGRFFAREDLVAIVGATEPHDYRQFFPVLGPVVSELGFCGGFHRAVAPEHLAAAAPPTTRIAGVFATPDQAIDQLLANERYETTSVIVTGSLFLVGAWRQALERKGLLKNGW